MPWFSVTSRNVSIRADKCSHPFHPIFLLKLFLCDIAADWSTPFLFSHFSHLFKGADRRCQPAPEYIPCFLIFSNRPFILKGRWGTVRIREGRATEVSISFISLSCRHTWKRHVKEILMVSKQYNQMIREKNNLGELRHWVQTMSSRCRFSAWRSLTPYLLHNHGQQDSH